MRFNPLEYQKRAIKFMVQQACAGLLLDMGLGKTSIAYAAFKTLKDLGYVNRMLVISPLRPAQAVWPAEAAKWDQFADLNVVVLHGPHKLERLKDKSVDVHVINPEGMPWLLKASARAKPTDDWPWEMLVVDESTLYKHTRTQRFKTIKPYLNMFRRRYILTGTPAPNGLLDLFGQVYLLDGGSALGTYVTHYRLAFFDNPDKLGWVWVPRAGAAEQIYKKLEPLCMRMSAADYLTLPELIFNDIVVDLPPAARRTYDQMENALIAQVAGGTVVAANAAAASGKCRQVAGGGIYTGAGDRAWLEIHDAKLDAVEEVVESLQGKPVIVVYEFDHERERLQRRFKGAPAIAGGMSEHAFKQAENAWNRGEVPVLLVQPAAAARGLNLQKGGSRMVFHSTPWNLEHYQQIIARIHRQGQRERCFVHHIVARNTVDELVVKVLGKKDRTQRALLDALKTYTEGRS